MCQLNNAQADNTRGFEIPLAQGAYVNPALHEIIRTWPAVSFMASARTVDGGCSGFSAYMYVQPDDSRQALSHNTANT